VNIIKYKTQKAVAHAQRAPQLFGFELFIMSTYLTTLMLTHRSWANLVQDRIHPYAKDDNYKLF